MKAQILKLVCGIMLCVGLISCAGNAPQLTGVQVVTPDGRIDEVEAATIRLAVGLALSSKPETIKPAYAVSTTLLAFIDKDYTSLLSSVDLVIKNELNRLNIDEPTKQSFNDLVVLIKAQINQQISANVQVGSANVSEQKRVMIVTVLKIVQESSSIRLRTI